MKRIERRSSFEQDLSASTNKSLGLFGACVASVIAQHLGLKSPPKKYSPNIFKTSSSRCNSHTVVRSLNVEANLNLKFLFFTLNLSVKKINPGGVGCSILYMIPRVGQVSCWQGELRPTNGRQTFKKWKITSDATCRTCKKHEENTQHIFHEYNEYNTI